MIRLALSPALPRASVPAVKKRYHERKTKRRTPDAVADAPAGTNRTGPPAMPGPWKMLTLGLLERSADEQMSSLGFR